MLDCAAGNSYFTCPVSAVGAVDKDVRGWRRFGTHIAFDIASGDVNVTDVAAARHDTALAIVAYLAADYVRLMQVDIVIKNTDTSVLIDVTVGNNQVSVIVCQVDAVQDVADVNPGNG